MDTRSPLTSGHPREFTPAARPANTGLAAVWVCAVMGLGAGAAAQDVVEVTTTGNGITRDEACRDALRKALEQGGKVEISSRSQVENFELIRDTIFSRADGIVTDYKILDQGDAVGGVTYCTVRAKVRKSAIASTWGEVQNVLDQMGRPGISVYILERIDGQVQDGSILEHVIERRLLDAGFDVYARSQLDAIAQKEAADAAADNNIEKMRAIAKRFGAHLFITGTAQASAAGVKNLYGEPTAMYNADAAVKMYATDTGKLLASESIPNWRGGARGFREDSPQAGKKAIENAGRDLVEAVYRSAMRQWATRISAGQEIRLEVEGMSLVDALKLKKMLAGIPGVERVHGPELDHGLATFRLTAKMTAQQMAEYLIQDAFLKQIEVINLKLNRIQARKVR